MSVDLNEEDIQALQDFNLSAEDIGPERIHDLFQQVFFSDNTSAEDDAQADDRDIDSQGNSKSPERPQQQQLGDQEGGAAVNDHEMDADELAALLGDNDDDDDEAKNREEGAEKKKDKKQQQKNDKRNRQVEDAVDEVLAAGAGEDGEQDEAEAEDIFQWDKISENEEQERDLDEFEDEDDEFKNWIRAGDDDRDGGLHLRRRQQKGGAEHKASDEEAENEEGEEGDEDKSERIPRTMAAARAALVQASMSKMGATEIDEKITRDPWPERLKELEILENRPGLRGSTLPDGSVVEISRDAEALWILRMLVQPGFAFERRAHVIHEVQKSMDWRAHPLVQSIEYALECFVEEQLEPAYLMLYRQSKFGPLVQELLRCDPSSRDAPDAWFGYCANTGRRQQIVSITQRSWPFVLTSLRTTRGSSVGTGYDGFRDFDNAGQPVIRRPAFIPLGRLLTDILFLDSLCHRLERHRHVTLDTLTQLNASALATSGEHQHFSHIPGLLHQPWFAPTESDMNHLSQIAFDTPHSSDVWSDYAEFFHRMQLAYTHLTTIAQGRFGTEDVDAAGMSWARSPSCRLILLGISHYFQEYALPGPYLHENVVSGQLSHISANRREFRNPLEWAEDIVNTLETNVRPSKETLLRHFNDALVEQLSVLPFVREAAMAVFVSDGKCEIAPSSRSADQQLRVVSVQSLLHRDPAYFLELLEDEAGGSSLINFTVELAAIERVLPIADLLQGCGVPATGDIRSESLLAWQRQLLRCREPTARRLQNTLRSHIRVLLHEAATRAVTKRCASSLGNLLAEGPYEPTTVRVNKERRTDVFDEIANSRRDEPEPGRPNAAAGVGGAFSRDLDPAVSPLWPVAYEVAEALPIHGVSTARTSQSQRRRVCGCVRGAGGVTVFAFIDSFGMLKHAVRWVDTAAQTQSGREIQRGQHDQLRRACRQFEPEVIAIAPTGDMRQSWRLFKEVQDCLARDQELENQTSGASVLQAHIPVVFSSPVVAKLMANASAIVEEFPRSDLALRVTVSLARHTQDPLRSIACLFDNSENGGSVGRLPIGCETFRESVLPRGQLYKKLEWEMVLWVAASGVDACALLGIPPLFAERHLQFVPGLGRRKAARLMQVLRNMPCRLMSRRELSVIVLKEFGGGSRLPSDISASSSSSSFRPSDDASAVDALRSHFSQGQDESSTIVINSTVVNAAPCLRVRPTDVDGYNSKSKISDNLRALYPDLASNNNNNDDQDGDDDDGNDDGEDADFFQRDAASTQKHSNNKKITIKTLLGDHNESLAHHLFDETLIPPEWYGIASIICNRAFGMQGAPTKEYAVAMARLSTLRQRHRILADAMNSSAVESVAIQATNQGKSSGRNVNFFGPNEVEFIVDEIINFGAVRSRRTYRKMTDARFFALVTGHIFVENRKKVSSDKKHQNAVLCIGDVVEGVPESIGISARDGFLTLRLQGSKGLNLVMRVEELPSELSAPLRDAVKEVQRQHALRGSLRSPQSAPVPAAFKTMTIYGRLQSVDLATGDARVGYESNPAGAVASLAFAAAAAAAQQQQQNVGLDSSRSRESGDVASIKSGQLTAPSRGNALRAASHILYKNVSNETAKSLLEHSDIGEAILRPCSQAKSGDVVVVVKAGPDRDSITNIPVFEERKPNGVVFYRLVDPLAPGTTKSLEFMEIDHLLERYVRPMGRRYRELFNHRRFAVNREQVTEGFDEQLAQVPNAFVYSIVEAPNHARCTYTVVYRSGSAGPERELKVCAAGSQLLLQNPRDPNGTNPWVRCDDAEKLTMNLKQLVCGIAR